MAIAKSAATALATNIIRTVILGHIVDYSAAFGVLYTRLVKTGLVPLEVILKALCDNPRKRFGIPESEGDFAVFDLDETYTVNPETFVSMGHATPFAGWQLTGDCIYTSVGGEAVWKKW